MAGIDIFMYLMDIFPDDNEESSIDGSPIRRHIASPLKPARMPTTSGLQGNHSNTIQ